MSSTTLPDGMLCGRGEPVLLLPSTFLDDFSIFYGISCPASPDFVLVLPAGISHKGDLPLNKGRVVRTGPAFSSGLCIVADQKYSGREPEAYFHERRATILLYDPVRIPRSPPSPPPSAVLAAHFPSSTSDHSATACNGKGPIEWALATLALAHGDVPVPPEPEPPSNYGQIAKEQQFQFVAAWFATTQRWMRTIACWPLPSAPAALWLFLNDRILGIGLGAAVLAMPATAWQSMLAKGLLRIQELIVHSPTRTVEWLTNNPAGLKLNGPYARFLGELATWFVTVWSNGPLTWARVLVLEAEGSDDSVVATQLQQRAFALVSALGGVSLVLALLGDVLLGGFVAHLIWMRSALRRLVAAQSRSVAAVLSLFLGRARNPLRGRMETRAFAPEQLLMSTLLFVVLVFLWPTTAVFACYFEAVYFAIRAAKWVVNASLVFLQTFPLYEVTVWLKDPGRVPGALQIRPSPWWPGIFELVNGPVPLQRLLWSKQRVVILPRP